MFLFESYKAHASKNGKGPYVKRNEDIGSSIIIKFTFIGYLSKNVQTFQHGTHIVNCARAKHRAVFFLLWYTNKRKGRESPRYNKGQIYKILTSEVFCTSLLFILAFV